MRRIEQGTSRLGQTPDSGPAPEPTEASQGAAALQQLITQHGDPARLLECYYWSMEPGLLECVRALLAAPAEVRTVLLAFFAAAIVRDQITATVDQDGSLTLRSPEAAAILARFFSNYSSGNLPRHCC